MSAVSATMVKDLRNRTGAGMMDCKKALIENEGDVDKAVDWLREKGISKAAGKAGRIASEGLVQSYIHAGGKIGVLLEVNCETDFTARNDKFVSLVKDIAMHIAAVSPVAVRREEIPADLLERERKVYKAQAVDQGKPEKIIEKIVDGRVEKYFKETCLLEQPFVKDTDKSIQDVVTEAIATIGENIPVRRFVRYELGEGIEKRSDDFAAEVAKAAGTA